MPTPEQACNYTDSKGNYYTYEDSGACHNVREYLVGDNKAWLYRTRLEVTATKGNALAFYSFSWAKPDWFLMDNLNQAICLMNE